MKSLKIGNVKIKNPLFLAPMVDVSDLPYRLICRKEGAAMAYSPMLYTSQILNENEKTLSLLKSNKLDSPLGIQVTGSSEKEFPKILNHLKKFDLIDINCGCPSIRLIGSEAGSFLLKNPDKIARIIKSLKNEGVTTTAKIRLGFNKNEGIKIAKKIEKAGADALTVHARLALDSYSKKADWSEIRKIKESIGIPVIGNGDILSPPDVKKMLEITDGAMIARGAIGSPQIFSQSLKYLKTGKIRKASPKKILSSFENYLSLSKKYEVIDLGRIKYLGAQFIKGFPGASEKRNEFSSLSSFEDVQKFIKSIKYSL